MAPFSPGAAARQTAAGRPPAAPPAGPRRSGRGRIRCAASPCSQTAALAASKAGMPCASRPATMPASTSPEPAVASIGGRIVGNRRAAVRRSHHGVGALQNHDRACFVCSQPSLSQVLMNMNELPAPMHLNKRANSPSCGVRTVGATGSFANCISSASGSPAKLVSASASSTTAAFRPSAAATLFAHCRADPAARPQHDRVEPRVGEQVRQTRRRRPPAAP